MAIETARYRPVSPDGHNGHVAPRRLLAQAFQELDCRVTLRTSYYVEQLVLMQSILGSAQGGRGVFGGNRFPATTEDDIARALRLDPQAVKEDRQVLIDEIADYARRAASGNGGSYLLNSESEPLLGIGTFRHIEVDPKGVLIGLYLGGLRDEPKIREEADKQYGGNIGYGNAYFVNRKVMSEMGLTADSLAKESHESDLETFRRKGLITDAPGPETAYLHVCHKSGCKASDDAAMIVAGKFWGLSAAVGCFLADAIDTLEKYAARTADQDAEVAEMIGNQCPDLGVTESDAARLAYLASIPEGMERKVPDCSLRGFLEVDPHHDICPLECHLLYIEGQPVPNINLDRGEATTHEFYAYIEERMGKMK